MSMHINSSGGIRTCICGLDWPDFDPLPLTVNQSKKCSERQHKKHDHKFIGFYVIKSLLNMKLIRPSSLKSTRRLCALWLCFNRNKGWLGYLNTISYLKQDRTIITLVTMQIVISIKHQWDTKALTFCWNNRYRTRTLTKPYHQN